MEFKKKCYAVILLLCMTAGVFYVGKSKIQMSSELEQQERESFLNRKKDTLYLWYTDENLTDYLNAAAVVYNEKTDVRVEPTLVSATEYLEAVNKASVGEESETPAPDLYLITNDCLEKAYLAGLATEIEHSDMFRNPDFESRGAEAAVTYDGKAVAYPFYYESCALLYNKTYLKDYARKQLEAELAGDGEEQEEGEDTGEEGSDTAQIEITEEMTEERARELIPDTIEELEIFADEYDAPEGVEAVFKWDVSDILYNYSFAGDHLVVGGENGDNPSEINIYNLETIQCLITFQELNQFFSIETREVSKDSVMQDFLDGKIVFTVMGTEAVNRMAEAKEDNSFPYEYGFYTMPDLTPELKSRSLSITTCIAVNGYSGQKKQANDLAWFLINEYGNELKLQERTGKMPVYGQQYYDELQSFRQSYEESMPMPKMMTTGNFWVQMEIAFTDIWEGGDANAILKALSEDIMEQVTGEEYEEEYIEVPVEEPEEETEEEPSETDSGENAEG